MNPYAPIRKVPLDYNGITSSAYSVQMDKDDKGWKEVGTVGKNYMLLSNDKVRDAAEQVAQESNVEFTHDKTFFNGKSFVYSMKSNHISGEIRPGDDVALGMQFWNSYDGSKSFGFAMMLYRLICTNGMMSKNFFNTYLFKHEPNSENWEESLEQVTSNINAMANGSLRLEEFIDSLKKLNSLHINVDELGSIRHNHLQDIPTGTWGQIVDRFTSPVNNNAGDVDYYYTGWQLLNAGTDILWHKENPTVASYNQNQLIVDGLCRAVA